MIGREYTELPADPMSDTHPAQTESRLPPAPLGAGPVLCMNIAGAIMTVTQRTRTAGFVNVLYKNRRLSLHPGLQDWFAELEAAYTHCAWTSGLQKNCAAFADSAGLHQARAWPYLASHSPRDHRLWQRLDDVAAWVDPGAPVAVVDFRMAPVLRNITYIPVLECVRDTVPLFLQRPGPTLLVAPTLHLGLSRRIVDLLCRFAHDPTAPEFAVRGVRRMHHDPALRWPDPLPPGLEEPVRRPILEQGETST